VTRHIDRKQLKKADQFVSFWTRVGAVVSARRQMVLTAALGAVVLVLASWGLSSLLSRRAAAASRDFSRIERVANADLIPPTADGPKPNLDDGLPHFKTEQERLEAALKEADTFLGAHGGSGLKDEAKLLKAKYLLALGKAGESAALYKALLTGGLDQRLRFLAEEGLAYAHEAAGQLDEAIGAFAALAEDSDRSGGFYRDRALFGRARLLQKKGNAKEAEKVLKEILEKTPTTPLREEINDRLASLEGK
jgi:tetratricopeptide (TPR) repeat protein